jgi:aspartate-semialdehyde dehydrogenase
MDVVQDNTDVYVSNAFVRKERMPFFVGRIRRDLSQENLNMWIVADNLRKVRLQIPFKLLNI